MGYKELIRGRVVYYITDTSVVASVGGTQYVSYNIYNSPSRSSLAEFKKILLASKSNEYGNAAEQMNLAQSCKLIGSGVSKPKWIKE